MASQNLNLSSTTQVLRKGTLAKDIIEVAEKDYKIVLRGIAIEQVENQIRIGNMPSNIYVDGRASSGIGIEKANRSVKVYFADDKLMTKAIIEAHDMLLARGRKVSGGTLDNIQYYKGKAGDAPHKVSTPTVDNIATALYVAVPVPWARKWQYYDNAGARLTRKSKAKSQKNIAAKDRKLVSRSLFEGIAKDLQKKYPSLRVSVIFIKVTGLGKVTTIPSIRVGMRTKGLVS